MKTNGLLSVITTLFLLFTTFSAAWPWQGLFEAKLDELVRRQQNNPSTNTGSSSSQPSSTASTITSPASTSSGGSSASASTSGSAGTSGTNSVSGSKSGSGSSKTSSHATKTTPIDPRLPPGGIQLITPAAIDGQQYYKVGDFVTFQWNYTSLSVTPSAVDVLASCAANSQTYTISANMSVQETGAVTWDLGQAYATATYPFPIASYTLMIHDAAKDVTDVPSAGYLGAYNQYVFGIYTGQPYVPLNDFKCATCNNGALSIHERQALGVLLGTGIITVLSFTWFANGFGAFS